MVRRRARCLGRRDLCRREAGVARVVSAGVDLHPGSGAAGDPARVGDRGRRERTDRRRPRNVADDQLRAAQGADPGLHRGLPWPADPRHRLHRLFRPARDLRRAQVRSPDRRCDRARPLGQRPGRRGHARRGPVDPARAARGRGCPRLRLERPSRLRDPAAGAAPAAAPLRQPARQHHPELDARADDRRRRDPAGGQVAERASLVSGADRDRRDPRLRDLRGRDDPLLRDLVPADAPGGGAREAARQRGIRSRRRSRSRGARPG